MKNNKFKTNEEIEIDIRNSFYKNEGYLKVLEDINCFIKRLDNMKRNGMSNIEKHYWFSYYMKCHLYKNNNMFNEAIESVVMSENLNILDTHIYLSKWLKACVYRDYEYKELAINEFYKCKKYYESIDDKSSYIIAEYEIYKMNNDKNGVKECITNYKKIKNNETDMFFEDENFNQDAHLQEMINTYNSL